MPQLKATLRAGGYSRAERAELRKDLRALHARADAAWLLGRPIVVLTFAEYLDLRFPDWPPERAQGALMPQGPPSGGAK